jgi:hypothetical protein
MLSANRTSETKSMTSPRVLERRAVMEGTEDGDSLQTQHVKIAHLPSCGMVMGLKTCVLPRHCGPPQGGDKKTVSTCKLGASANASPSTNSMRSATP